MPQYTVRDETSGRTVTFDWTGDGQPTDADMAEVFAAAGSQPEPEPETTYDGQSLDSLRNDPRFKQMQAASDARMQNMPAAASMSAAMLTGGMSLPVQMGAVAATRYGAERLSGNNETAGKSAILDGLLQGAGSVVSKGLEAGGNAIYRGLAKPVKALRDSFGGDDMVRTAIEEGTPITAGGVSKMAGKVAESRSAALGLVDDAEKAGVPGVAPGQVARAYPRVVSELRRRVDIGQPTDLGAVGRRGRAIANTAQRTGGRIPLTRAQQLKETAQDSASGAYRQMSAGGSAQLSADNLLDEATARGLREGIEQQVPGVGAQNAVTQKRLGALRMLEDAMERQGNNNAVGGMKDLIAIGGGAGIGQLSGNPEAGTTAGLLMALLSRPGMGSRAAIGMNRASKANSAQVARLLQSLMSTHGTEEP